ncbi:hypothetical protein CGMCC3_g14775 [Colletotrichum fructicola]|nr:uncharacterized protein CGMCC3_g14775 [Colletotrichum fructicola]KAE9569191.1 hypothetical protein CGMCC3_g14775 [Colletotrichum fructicola]
MDDKLAITPDSVVLHPPIDPTIMHHIRLVDAVGQPPTPPNTNEILQRHTQRDKNATFWHV